jgi:DNA-binding IclR family transcriptional regulator
MRTQVLTTEETAILEAFGCGRPHLTLGQLRRSTSLPVALLITALETLRDAGLLARLNTVVESYALREASADEAFPAR